MHMISKKDLNSAKNPTTVMTANGEVQTNEEATDYVRELDIFLTMKLLDDTPAVNTDTQTSGSTVKNHISLNIVFEFSAIRKTSTTFSNSSTPTSTTPSGQEIDHSDHHPAIVSSESVERQVRKDPFTSETSEELLHEPTEIPKPK